MSPKLTCSLSPDSEEYYLKGQSDLFHIVSLGRSVPIFRVNGVS